MSLKVHREELLVQGGKLDVRKGAPELGQGLHVQLAQLAQAGYARQQRVRHRDVAFYGQLVALGQLATQRFQDGRVQRRNVVNALQAWPVWGSNKICVRVF